MPTSLLFASPTQTLAATAPGSVKVTVPPTSLTGVTIESVFTSAVVDWSEQVDTPEALVTEQAPIVLFEPVAENVGTTPARALLFVSLRVIVTVEAATPSARTGPVPVMVELVAPAPAMMSSSVFETTVNRCPAVALTGTTVVPLS